MLESAMEEEMTEHVGHEKHGSPEPLRDYWLHRLVELTREAVEDEPWGR